MKVEKDTTQQLEWIEKDIAIADLNEYEHNPRRITKRAFERLVQSLKQDGYHGRIIIDTDNNIIAGHQRKAALLRAGWQPTDKIKVLSSTRKLTEEEFKRINIRDNLDFGDFDMDVLSNNFDMDFLKDIGMDFTFNTVPALDLEPVKLTDLDAPELCKRCPHREAE